MKQVGLALSLVLAGVSASEAQAPQLELESELRSRAALTLHAPMGVFVASMSATAALAVSFSVLAITHCDDGDCDSLTRQTNATFAATLAAATLTLTSLVWVITRSVKRRNSRALQALQVLGSGLRF